MTPHQRCVLEYMIRVGGEALAQTIAYECCSFRNWTTADGVNHVHYPTPQRATQIGGAVFARLVKLGYVERTTSRRLVGLRYHVTAKAEIEIVGHAIPRG